MRKSRLMLATVASLVAGAVTGSVVAAGEEEATLTAPEGFSDPAAIQALDMGAGEEVLLVVGGSFGTKAEADAANAGISFGDLQGFYVARTSQFDGLRKALGSTAGDFVLVSAFRTQAGAEELLDLARTVGAPASILGPFRNAGTAYVGLGQESSPDGSGPLTAV